MNSKKNYYYLFTENRINSATLLPKIKTMPVSIIN